MNKQEKYALTLENLERWQTISNNSPEFSEIANEALPVFIVDFIRRIKASRIAIDHIRKINKTFTTGDKNESDLSSSS